MTTCEYNYQCKHYMKDSDLCEEVSRCCILKIETMKKRYDALQMVIKQYREKIGFDTSDESPIRRLVERGIEPVTVKEESQQDEDILGIGSIDETSMRRISNVINLDIIREDEKRMRDSEYYRHHSR